VIVEWILKELSRLVVVFWDTTPNRFEIGLNPDRSSLLFRIVPELDADDAFLGLVWAMLLSLRKERVSSGSPFLSISPVCLMSVQHINQLIAVVNENALLLESRIRTNKPNVGSTRFIFPEYLFPQLITYTLPLD